MDSETMSPGAALDQAVAGLAGCLPALELEEFLALLDDRAAGLYNRLAGSLGEGETAALLLKLTNLLLARYEFFHRRTRLASLPFSLTVDPANGCNLHCPGCVHSRGPATSAFLWPPGMLTQESFGRFLEAFGPTAVQVVFYNYGEPFLNRRTPELIRMARRYLLTTSCSTNLSHADLDAEAIVESGLDFLVLSVDGASPETYSRYRRGGDFSRVLENVRRLVRAKKNRGSAAPLLQWQFLVFRHNAHEIPQVERMAREIGVDQLSLVRPYDVDWDDPEIRAQDGFETRVQTFSYDVREDRKNHAAMLPGFDREAFLGSLERGWQDRAPPEDEPPRTPGGNGPICKWLHTNITLDAAGRIMPCCMAPARDKNLVFASAEDAGREGAGGAYNADLFALARLRFRDPEVFARRTRAFDRSLVPYCGECPMAGMRPVVDTSNVREYLDRLPLFDLLSAGSKSLLTAW